MTFVKNTTLLKRISIGISFFIISLILWNTYSFFTLFKSEERAKMEVIAVASKEFELNSDLEDEFVVESMVIENNKNIPLILTDDRGVILDSRNLNAKKLDNENYMQQQLNIMKSQNKPIMIPLPDNKKQYLYYRNSDLITKLTYYPLALILILALFSSVVYMVFHSSKIAEQNKLWTGMAKETAHQIGTPLSSLLGWIAILRERNSSEKYVDEIEKDVHRLNTIASRFSKIGSNPKLKPKNVVEISRSTMNYLQSRSSKQVDFRFETSDENIQIPLSEELFGWVIENLIKNAIDAMQGNGSIVLKIWQDKQVHISLSDTGKGIPKTQFKQIFKPGFTTKKRGWGLGLSLSKRVIEDYHNGKISIAKSGVGKGTIFLISLNPL